MVQTPETSFLLGLHTGCPCGLERGPRHHGIGHLADMHRAGLLGLTDREDRGYSYGVR